MPNGGQTTRRGRCKTGAIMSKSENKLARQAYKRAIVDCLQAIQALDTAGDVGVTFWATELQGTLGRQIGKLAATELPAVKLARHASDNAALAAVTAERDALAARLASLGRGERAKVRESRAEAGEAWARLSDAAVYAGEDCNPEPEEPNSPCPCCDGSGWIDDGNGGDIVCIECVRAGRDEFEVHHAN